MHWVILIFILVPAIEIGIFIWTGSVLGPWPVFLIIILTGIVGVAIVKRQGMEVWKSAQIAIHHREVPKEQILDGICIIIGGIFLLAPGFMTDLIGFLLVLPWTRKPFEIFISYLIIKQIRHGKIIFRKW